MGFEDRQIRQLRARLNPKAIREREADGVTVRYLEGSHAISEANRIFGFDGWDRETLEAKCVYTKQIGDRYAAAYVTRVRITVNAGGTRVVREGVGAGEATTDSPGSAHERAAKAAETDATKRALVTFGNRFGLSLYGQKQDHGPDNQGNANGKPYAPFHANGSQTNGVRSVEAEPMVTGSVPTGHIDKHALVLGEPRRIRDTAHLRYVASQPCAVCGRGRCQVHHITFAQPRALGRKVSDEFTVPLCAKHHRELHQNGDERDWWRKHEIDPTSIAQGLWQASLRNGGNGFSGGTRL
jgi:DNA recombination protein Rad52